MKYPEARLIHYISGISVQRLGGPAESHAVCGID